MREYDFSGYTDAQLTRLHYDCWNRMSRDDGYQPFGYDLPTIRLTKPAWYPIMVALDKEGRKRLAVVLAPWPKPVELPLHYRSTN